MKTKSNVQLILIFGFLWTTCLAYVSIVEPVNDDFDEGVGNYDPQYYFNVKRSYIYPENDVERYAMVPELENDDKKDLIKGPSIDPIIDGTEDMGADQEYSEQERVEEMHKNFYGLKPESEETENGRKFSKIDDGKTLVASAIKKNKHKISSQEKEEISEGLIKLLYDWKSQKGQDGSGSEADGKKQKTQKTEKAKNFADENRGEPTAAFNNADEEDIDTRKENEQAEIDTALHDPVAGSKAAGNEVALGNQEQDDADNKPTAGLDDGVGSGEGKDNKSKARGKINVLVNVNINERSLRSKVSHAHKKQKSSLKSVTAKRTKDEELVAKELTSGDGSGDASDESGDIEDEETEEDDTENEGASKATEKTNANLANNTQPTAQFANNVYQNYSQTPVYATAYQPAAPAPQIPVAQPAPQMGYQPPQQPYQQSYATRNNYQTPYMALNYQPAPKAATELAVTIEDNSSGEDEESEGSKKTEEENGSTSDSSGSGATQPLNVRPAKPQTARNKERTAQIFFPGTMMTVTGTHEKKPEKEEKSEEEESLEEDDEHGSKEEGAEETEEVDKETAEKISEYKPVKERKIHRKKNKKHKHNSYVKQKDQQESLGTVRVKDSSSKAMRKVKKLRHNPHKVTTTTDNVGKVDRPSEATKSKPARDRKLAHFKALETGKKSKAHYIKLHDSESKEDKVHFVRLHESELRLLKEEKAKLAAASEPIVIDDIKKKHEKPKPIPKEATNINKTAAMSKFTSFHEREPEAKKVEQIKPEQTEFKPTTKRSYVTPNKEPAKPEVVVPPAKQMTENASALDGSEKTGTSDAGSNDAGSGDAEAKKYGSLKLVRERFKEWEKEMISKLSNPYLKDNLMTNDTSQASKENSSEQKDSFDSWKDEEKDLINRLSNPYLHENQNKKETKKEEVKESKDVTDEANKNKKENTDKNQSAENEVKKVQGNVTKQDNHTTDLKNKEETSSAVPQKNEQPQSELPINKEKENQMIKNVASEAVHLLQSFAPRKTEKIDSNVKEELEGKKTSYDQLEKFKKQIMAEVGKINKLQEEYKSNLMQSSELDKAKDTLNKDLSSIKNIEKKMTNALKKKQEKTSKTKSKDLKTEMIPNPLKSKGAKKDDPLVKIQALLQEEMVRTKKKKKKGHDKQLDNIRGLLKNELTRLIDSGKLGSPNDLPAGLKKLGTMIHKKLKNTKKRKPKKKKPKKDTKNTKVFGNDLKNSLDLMKEYKPTVAGSAKDMITTANSYKAAMQAMEDLKTQQKLAGSDQNDTSNSFKPSNTSAPAKGPQAPAQSPTKPHVVMPGKLPTGAQTDQFKNLLQNLNKKIGEVYSRLQSSDNGQQHKGNNAPNNNGQAKNNAQLNNMVPGSNNGPGNNNAPNNNGPGNNNAPNNNGQGNNNAQNNNAQGNNNAQLNSNIPGSNNGNNAPNNNAQGNNNVPNANGFINNIAPSTNNAQAMNNVPQPVSYAVPQNQQPIPDQRTYNPVQAKNEMPEPDEQDEPEPDNVLAETEPVESLIENLEKDITEVWSYKDSFPDAAALGLDNDKIHQTYANLGSLSGLSLRRALDRALRGKDVGLAIVGGSISKGGPFSEKGVEFAVKTYFYAIADWWNKVIRPITGSSMIVRDVSIGGIATDYYSYCLRNHLPNDKLTNIVLWELAANDMRRYDDKIKPKPQSLEQFTQNVLSYKAKPALIFLNFFALFGWDQDLVSHCRNFEDEGENEIAKHYKVTSLSWRDMVCSAMQQNTPLFTRGELFAEDQFHPSIEAHAQMAYVVIDYIRTEFLKNLVKQRFLEIGDAARRLKIPDTIYVPKPIYQETFTWKPVCYTYMMVDNQQANNTLKIDPEGNGDFQYTVLREFKVRSDKIIGMETKKSDQYLIYKIQVPPHPKGDMRPYKKLAIMSFTDDRQAEVRFDNSQVQNIDTTKTFLEGTTLKYVASNVPPGEHRLVIKSGPGGFVVSAVMLG